MFDSGLLENSRSVLAPKDQIRTRAKLLIKQSIMQVAQGQQIPELSMVGDTGIEPVTPAV
jgi:hypothetical protein